MSLFAIISNFRIQDGLDILFLTVVAYHLFVWFQGTKALKALIGLLILGAVFTVARTWGLFLTTWMFQFMWQILIILIVVLFQSEIRQVLEKVNPLQRLGFRRLATPGGWVSGFAGGVFELARKKTGALIIIQRWDKVNEYVTEGQRLEADATPEVLQAIFQKESPIHDGAVVLKQGQIVEVACYLPLTPAEGLPREWGTRHRAALGLSERCDAWVVIVSEERGQVSLAREGQIQPVPAPQDLSALVREASAPAGPAHEGWKERMRFHLTHRWRTKLITFGLVSLLWLILAGQQNFDAKVTVPVEIKHLPEQIEIVKPLNAQVTITVRGLRKDASTLEKENVSAEINASRAYPGEMVFPITRHMIRLPDDRVQLLDITPPEMTFTFKAKGEQKEGQNQGP
ncbi:MAG: diadenylate cyclase [Desulfobacteraceae bacterium]